MSVRFVTFYVLGIFELGILSCSAQAVAPLEAPVKMVRGESFSGTLTSIDSSWNLNFASEERHHIVPLDNFIVWGQFQEPFRNPLVQLRDGSRIPATIKSINSEFVVVESRLWQQVKIPRRLVEAIWFQMTPDLLERDRVMIDAISDRSSTDRVLMNNQDQLDGWVDLYYIQPVTLLSGQPGELNILKFQLGNGRTPSTVAEVRREQIKAIIFSSSPEASKTVSPPKAILAWKDGSVLRCQKINKRREYVEFEIQGELTLKSKTLWGVREIWQQATMAQGFPDRVIYLSNLEQRQFSSLPTFKQNWTLQKDKNVKGGLLRSSEHLFFKGLGVHSDASLAYDLTTKPLRFEADLAIDQSSGRRGSVVFKIYTTSGAQSWSEIYQSEIVRGGEPPVSISVNIEGALAIALVVEHAESGQILDRANWLNARLVH